MTHIIVNADDFGLNTSVNKAIVTSFKLGLINSTTLMANMEGFEEAVELAYKHHLKNKIGIHLNLNKEFLLTSGFLFSALFSLKNRNAHKENRNSLFLISQDMRRLIYNEFASQISKVRSVGLPITHIDSHHHLHEIWPITKIVFALLKDYDIPKMRITNNLKYGTNVFKRMYRNYVNRCIKKKKVHFSNYFGNQLEALRFLGEKPENYNKIIEIMVHPVFNSYGMLVDEINLSDKFYQTFKGLENLLSKEIS